MHDTQSASIFKDLEYMIFGLRLSHFKNINVCFVKSEIEQVLCIYRWKTCTVSTMEQPSALRNFRVSPKR